MNKLLVKSMLIFVLIHCFFGFSIKAQDGFIALTDITEFNNNLELSSKNTKTILCDFVQEKNMSMLTKKVISKGHFCYKKPGFIRWEYIDPYSYLIVFAKKKVFIKDNDSKKQYDAQSNKMFKEMGVMLFSFVQGNIPACEKDYVITYMENTNSYYVKLVTKTAKLKEMLTQVDLYFDKKDFSVSKIKMIETGGDYTLLEFINKKLNNDISDSVFSVK